MTEEIINLIAEQLRNEFPESGKNMSEAALRIYNVVMLEQPYYKVVEARDVIKSVLKTLVNI